MSKDSLSAFVGCSNDVFTLNSDSDNLALCDHEENFDQALALLSQELERMGMRSGSESTTMSKVELINAAWQLLQGMKHHQGVAARQSGDLQSACNDLQRLHVSVRRQREAAEQRSLQLQRMEDREGRLGALLEEARAEIKGLKEEMRRQRLGFEQHEDQLRHQMRRKEQDMSRLKTIIANKMSNNRALKTGMEMNFPLKSDHKEPRRTWACSESSEMLWDCKSNLEQMEQKLLETRSMHAKLFSMFVSHLNEIFEIIQDQNSELNVPILNNFKDLQGASEQILVQLKDLQNSENKSNSNSKNDKNQTISSKKVMEKSTPPLDLRPIVNEPDSPAWVTGVTRYCSSSLASTSSGQRHVIDLRHIRRSASRESARSPNSTIASGSTKTRNTDVVLRRRSSVDPSNNGPNKGTSKKIRSLSGSPAATQRSPCLPPSSRARCSRGVDVVDQDRVDDRDRLSRYVEAHVRRSQALTDKQMEALLNELKSK